MEAAERETIVTTDDATDMVTVWTAQQRYITRLKKDKDFQLVDEGSGWAQFTIPADRWSPAGVKRTRRKMSDSERDAALARLYARKG